MFKVLFLPVKVAVAFVKVSGVRGSLLLLLGVVVGLLFAPQRGAQLRAELRARLEQAGTAAGLPADRDLSL